MLTLQFSTGRALDSAVIRWFTWSKISHVDFVLPDGCLLGARLDRGVKVRPANYATFTYKVLATADIPEQPVLDYALSQIGKPYDWRAIVNFGFHRDWRSPDSWFCSELVAWACEAAGYPLLNPAEPHDRVTPRDLMLSPLLSFVQK